MDGQVSPLGLALSQGKDCQVMTTKVQTYECRLKKAGVLRVADVAADVQLRSAELLARVAQPLVRDLPHEQVWAILLSGQLTLIGAVRVGEGGMHGCALRPADVFRPVIAGNASAFALVHNHPSGDPTPSGADHTMTRQLLAAARLLGIDLVDHLILTQRADRWHSMFQQGELATLGGEL